jgi:hypothetical protein
MNMNVRTEWHDPDWSGAHCLELGSLNEQEMRLFSLLISHRRRLPIYLGDAWRCDVCEHECTDIEEMADHIVGTHEPEPMNTADWEELLHEDPEADSLF